MTVISLSSATLKLQELQQQKYLPRAHSVRSNPQLSTINQFLAAKTSTSTFFYEHSQALKCERVEVLFYAQRQTQNIAFMTITLHTFNIVSELYE